MPGRSPAQAPSLRSRRSRDGAAIRARPGAGARPVPLVARHRVLLVLEAGHVVPRIFAVVRPAVARSGNTFDFALVEGRARRELSFARRERVRFASRAVCFVYFLAGK